MKKISIIIPVYNAEQYIDNCLKSLIEQTYKNIEIILVDDGSKDSSYDICLEYSKKYNFIKTFHKTNGGPSSARNFGINKASGDYICFVDSDDTVSEYYIEKLLENKEDIVLGGFIELINENKKNVKMCNSIQMFKDEEIYIKFLEASESDIFNSPWCKLYKRNIIEKNKLRYDESLRMGEDLEFNINYLKYCKSMIIIPDCLYYYNKNVVGSLTKKFEITRWNTEKKIYYEYKKIYELNNLYINYKSNIDCMLLQGAKKTIYILCASNTKYDESIKYINDIVNDVEMRKVVNYIKPKNKMNKILLFLIKNRMITLIYMMFKLITKIHKK